MEVKRYQPELHQEQLISWYNQWNIPLECIELLPTTGLIVENVCALFWYETNSKVCFIENMICNKEAEETSRILGLNMVCKAVEEQMKQHGCKRIISFSQNPKVLQRAMNFECQVSPNPFYVLYRSF